MKAKAAAADIFPTFRSFCRFFLSPLSLPKAKAFFCSSTSTNETLQVLEGDSAQLFSRYGCTPSEISKIFLRGPSLLKTDVTLLESKLNLLRNLGFTASHLVKMINCRPRFLSFSPGSCFDERIHFLQSLFGSREMLVKAATRNPSLLNYHVHNFIKPAVSLYQEMGITGYELAQMLLSRPTLISRTSFDPEKLDYIRRIGLSKDSKMYKYVVSLIGISRIETIREKVANLEKFGFSHDEVMGLFRRSPLFITLSVEKVQRNMTFVIGTMKLPATVILDHTFILFCNLESVLKPRFLLAEKLRALGLQPKIKGCTMVKALRMKEPRFLKVFVRCHAEDISNSLMEFYTKTKGIKRLADTSRRSVNKGFPF